jgi:hypothetical protein
MSTVEKVAMGMVAIGMATALLLPGRQTVPVINGFRQLFTGGLHTAITGAAT